MQSAMVNSTTDTFVRTLQSLLLDLKVYFPACSCRKRCLKLETLTFSGIFFVHLRVVVVVVVVVAIM